MSGCQSSFCIEVFSNVRLLSIVDNKNNEENRGWMLDIDFDSIASHFVVKIENNSNVQWLKHKWPLYSVVCEK